MATSAKLLWRLLIDPNIQMVDAFCGETFVMKSEDEAWTLFENLSNNYVQHVSTRHREPALKAPKTKGLFEIGHSSDVATQVVDAITRKLDQLLVAGLSPNLLTCTHYLNHAHFVLVICIISMTSLLLEIMLMFLMSRSMQLSHDLVMIRIPIPTTQGGEIIPTSHGRLKLRATQPQDCIIKLNPIGNPTSLLPHIGLHNSKTRLHYLLDHTLTLRIGYWKLWARWVRLWMLKRRQ